MTDIQANLIESMVTRYGPLMNFDQLAKVLHRSTGGLRMAFHTGGDYIDELNTAKVRIGRRVYFRTQEVATLFFRDSDEN